MTQRVKSPVWAIVLLLICLVLRFCDSLLFGEGSMQKNFPRKHTSRQGGTGKLKIIVKLPAEAKAGVADSVSGNLTSSGRRQSSRITPPAKTAY